MRRPGWLIALLACVMVCVFIVGWRNLTVYAAQATQPPDIQNAIDALFTQTAQAQDQSFATRTAQHDLDLSATSTAIFQETVVAAFEADVRATQAAEWEADAASRGIEFMTTHNLERLQPFMTLNLGLVITSHFRFSADGDYLFAGGLGASIYDLRTEHNTPLVNVEGVNRFTVINMVVDDRNHLLAGVDLKESERLATDVLVWDIPSGTLRYTIPNGVILGLGFIQMDRPLLALLDMRVGQVRLLNALTGTLVNEYNIWGHLSRIYNVEGGDFLRAVFTPDGRRIAVVFKQVVAVYDVLTGDHITGWEVPALSAAEIHSAAFMSDGVRLAIGVSRGQVHLYNVDRQVVEQVLDTGLEAIINVQANADDTLLALSSGSLTDSETVALWDFQADAVHVLARGYDVPGFAFSPDGSFLAITTLFDYTPPGVELWAVVSESLLPTFAPTLTAMVAQDDASQATAAFFQNSAATSQAVGTALRATVTSLEVRGSATPAPPEAFFGCAYFGFFTDQPAVKGFINSDSADLLDAAADTSPVLMTIAGGTPVQVIGQTPEEDYAYICTVDGDAGWIPLASVTLTDAYDDLAILPPDWLYLD